MIQLVETSSLPALKANDDAGFSDRVHTKEIYAKAVKEWKSTAFSVDFTQFIEKRGLSYLSDAVEGMLLGTYEPERYPIVPRKEWKIEFTGLPAETERIL